MIKHVPNIPVISQTNYPHGTKHQGKVRDIYDLGKELLIITTDRLSAFDRQIAVIPNKGKVLNLLSLWWYEKAKHILPNPLISSDDPNSMRVHKCQVFPIEFVVRNYITGSTNTSLWHYYQSGAREYCGNKLPDNLVKNQKLAQPIITPTTKSDEHDKPISPKEIINKKLMSEEHWDYVSAKILALFNFGAYIADKAGLILVDTKYELGLDPKGDIVILDEVHTPDSSRFWLKESYQTLFEQNQEPESFDKEFIRLWFKQHCDPYHDKTLPEAPKELVQEVSRRYEEIYWRLTAKSL